MRIGIVGSESIASVIRQVEQEGLNGIELLYCCSNEFEDTPELVRKLQNQGVAEAILFTGPANYEYARKRMNPTLPWSYIPHSRLSVYRALLEAAIRYKSDLHSVSVDRYEEQLFRGALGSMGIENPMILEPSFPMETADYQKQLYHFHRDCYRKGMTSMAFTAMEYIARPLQAEGIPCVRILASEDVIRERLMQLAMSRMADWKHRGKIAVLMVLFDYVFDREMDVRIREWEKIRYQNQCKEHVHQMAQQMEAAVFEEGINCFYLVTDRELFQNTFGGMDYWKFLHFAGSSDQYMIWLGIGIGNTVLEAKSRASHAMNQSRRDRSGSAYFVGEKNDVHGPYRYETDTAERSSIAYLAGKLGIDRGNLERLKEAVNGKREASYTARELSERLGITERSMDRIIRKLEEAGAVTVVGKQSEGKGRPARRFQIELH